MIHDVIVIHLAKSQNTTKRTLDHMSTSLCNSVTKIDLFLFLVSMVLVSSLKKESFSFLKEKYFEFGMSGVKFYITPDSV